MGPGTATFIPSVREGQRTPPRFFQLERAGRRKALGLLASAPPARRDGMGLKDYDRKKGWSVSIRLARSIHGRSAQGSEKAFFPDAISFFTAVRACCGGPMRR